MTQNMNPEAKKLINKLLMLNGAIFLIGGCVLLVNPNITQTFLGLDKTINTILSSGLMVVGFSDFLIARFIFGGSERK